MSSHEKRRWVEREVTSMFSEAGISLGRTPERKPWEIEVIDEEFFPMVFLRGHDGFADAFVRGYWRTDSLDQCVFKMVQSGILDRWHVKYRLGNLRRYASDSWWNKQAVRKAQENVERHYNLGAVFGIMLDPTMSYSCAYWNSAKTLEEAQVAKLNHICQKLGLTEGMSFCDIGCGWGGLITAAYRHGAKSYGITLSTDQLTYIQQGILQCAGAGNVAASLTDYRGLTGEYDRIASVGMFEHVGLKNYRRYMRTVSSHLKEDGLFLLHTIGSRIPSPTLKRPELAWIEKHIFPGAVPPALGQIHTAADGIFTGVDTEEFGHYYDPTLMAWAKNFENGWPTISHLYPKPEEFRRKWSYYLHACAAEFRAGRLQLWQIVFAKPERNKLYKGVRPLFEG